MYESCPGASLWTAQAMAYRHKNGVDHNAVAMAVVAQVMVPSEISGIMFTANPATGARGEIIINASFGLGEAVVSGQVTPDTYTVDRTTGEISTDIGAKMQRIVSDGEQGVRMEDIEEASRGTSSLSDEQVAELVSRAKQIESIFETGPQDIEW
jgi:phosphoenolpyruvate synthase/pyruvate phosphate dikinase